MMPSKFAFWFIFALPFHAFFSYANGQVFNETLKIIAKDSQPNDQFGFSIAMDQGIIAIGAPFDSKNGTSSGSAYLFDASSGVQLAKLKPDGAVAGSQFGFSIDIHNGLVIVGAPLDEHNGMASGAAYIFDASTGVELGKLVSADAEYGDEFGYSVAIDSGMVAVGAIRDGDLGDSSGAAFLFDSETGVQLEKLVPNTGAANQTFGISIAMEDGIVAVGSRTYFVLGEGFTFATAYLFDATNGDQLHAFESQNVNGDQGGGFSESIGIDNGLVAVGAWARSIFFDHSGAAYVFNAKNGSQLHYIFPQDGHDRDNFGQSVAINNGRVAMGAPQDDDTGFNSGSAYIFDASSGNQLKKLLASDGADFDEFGSSIAIYNNLVAVGAPRANDETGAVYVYFAFIIGDVNQDGAVDLLDVQPFVFLLAKGQFQSEADINGDGNVNLLDVDGFIEILTS